jgi:hypothetical protein
LADFPVKLCAVILPDPSVPSERTCQLVDAWNVVHSMFFHQKEDSLGRHRPFPFDGVIAEVHEGVPPVRFFNFFCGFEAFPSHRVALIKSGP